MSTRVIQKIIQFIHLVLHRGFGSFTSNPYIFKINNIVPRCSGTFIKRCKNVRIIGITASTALVLLTLASVFPITKTADDAEGTAGVVEVPTLTMVTGQENASVDVTPTSATGTFATSATADEAKFTVQTDNYTGYTLTIKANDNAGQLINSTTGDTLDSITAATDQSTFTTGSAATYNNKWGYKPSKFNSTANTNYLPAPTTTASVLDKTTIANPTANTYTIALGARVDYTKPVGTYSSTYTLTAVANPVAYHISYYDGVNTAVIGNQQSETSTASITVNPTYTSGSAPTRSTYTFKSWCLGTVNSTTTYNTSTKTYSNQATVCTGTEYATGATMLLDPTVDNTNIKLYAVWTPTTFDQAYAAASKTKNATTNHYQMQDINSTICSAVTINQYGTLTDSRDNQNYTVGKLEDGHCWLADNLNFDAYTNRNSITTANTNVDATSLTSFKSGNRSAGVRYATAGIASSWTTTNSYTQAMIKRDGSCDSSKNSAWQCLSPYQGASYTYNTVIDKYGADPGQNGSGTATTTYNIGPGSYKIGTYYNYCAASAGNYCYDSSGTNVPPTTSKADYDICPKGWRIPSGGASGEYQALDNALKAKYPSTYRTSTSPYSMQSMLSTPVSGDYVSGTAWRQGVHGTFWSSNYYSATGMYRMSVYGTGVSPQGSTNRNTGYSVRCIAQY
ncbi:hypothetical protein IJI86_03325 [Candidatus Saccharibacteria bacterium]|nr:hypothetical protein [Candidatus Saccharibacteria bacterium]